MIKIRKVLKDVIQLVRKTPRCKRIQGFFVIGLVLFDVRNKE